MINIKKSKLHDSWVLFAALFFLYTTALGGVLRYLLTSIHFGGLIYLPKALILLTAVLLAAMSMLRRKISRALLGWLILLALSAILGLLYTRNVAQVAFGLWTLAPFIFGIVAYPTLTKHWRTLKRYLGFLWLLIIVGIGLGLLVDLPWVGYTYSLQGVEFQASHLWFTTGIQRLAGFSRASFDAAAQVVLLGSLLALTHRNWLWRISAWLLSGAAIALTTSKTAALIFVVVSLFLLGKRFLPKLFWIALSAAITLIMICLPLSTLLVHYDLNTNSTITHFLFASFGDRLSNTWPQAFALIQEHGNVILGRGMGGVGSPAKYFDPLLANPADNLFVYLYALFGVISFFILGTFNAIVVKLDLRQDRLDAFMYTVMLSTLVWGLAANVLELPFTSFFLGLALRYGSILFRRARKGVHAQRQFT